MREAEERIIRPVLAEMRRLGTPYQGVLYCGLMCTDEGVKVVEFNARFGDPECQILMPLLKTDLVDLLTAACDGRLDQVQVECTSEAAVCVVMASDGYPQSYEKGLEIRGLEAFADRDDIVIFHAGTAQRDGRCHYRWRSSTRRDRHGRQSPSRRRQSLLSRRSDRL